MNTPVTLRWLVSALAMILPACFSEAPPSGDEGDDGSDSQTAGVCGNGVLDPDEACDEELGCTDCELDNYICNPLNQVGCNTVQTCDRSRGATLTDQRTGCFQNGLAEWGAACEYNALLPSLQCADGLSCVGAQFHASCAAAECCTEFCDLTDPSTCPNPDTACLTWKEPGMPPGLDTLGLCILVQ